MDKSIETATAPIQHVPKPVSVEPPDNSAQPRAAASSFLLARRTRTIVLDASVAPGVTAASTASTLDPSVQASGAPFILATIKNFQQAFADFMLVDVANGDATADTIKAYYRGVKYWVQWREQNQLDPATAKRSHIEAYRRELKDAGYNVSTRSHKLSIIRRFYDAGVKHHLLKNNPAVSVRGGKDLTPPEEKMKALTWGTLATLLKDVPHSTLSGLRDRAIIGLIAIHGLRRGEVHRLNHRSLVETGEAPYLLVDGKGNKQRRVYLREDTQAALQEYAQAKVAHGYSTEEAFFLAHGNIACPIITS